MRVPQPIFFWLGGDIDVCPFRSEIIVEFEINPVQHRKPPPKQNLLVYAALRSRRGTPSGW